MPEPRSLRCWWVRKLITFDPVTRRMLLKMDNSPFTRTKVFSSRAQGITRAQRKASAHPWHLTKQMDHKYSCSSCVKAQRTNTATLMPIRACKHSDHKAWHVPTWWISVFCYPAWWIRLIVRSLIYIYILLYSYRMGRIQTLRNKEVSELSMC
jgi:hypothetical protein